MNLSDREKQRREYLKKKAGGFSKGFGAALAAMVMAAVTGLLIFFGTCICIGACLYGNGSFLLLGGGLLIVAYFLGRLLSRVGITRHDRSMPHHSCLMSLLSLLMPFPLRKS
jgi:hypothetical protein